MCRFDLKKKRIYTLTTVPKYSKSTREFVVFDTRSTVEVDEPSGFWSVRASRGPERLSEFDELIGNPDYAYRRSVEIQMEPSANLWFIKIVDDSEKETVVWKLTEGNPPEPVHAKVFDEQKQKRSGKDSEISPSGRYRIEKGPRSRREGVLLLKVWDTQALTTFPLIRCHGKYAHGFFGLRMNPLLPSRSGRVRR